MAIGIVSDDDLARELEKISTPKKVVPSSVIPEIVEMEKKGRKEGDVNVPDSLRQIIAEEHLLNGRQSALGLAKMFDISPASVSAYANGSTSTASYGEQKPSIINHINKSRARAIKRASKTLNGALNAITQEKLDYTDAKDLSVIAKNMSGIIKDLEPDKVQSDNPDKPITQFVLYAPQFRDERSFEVIHVQE